MAKKTKEKEAKVKNTPKGKDTTFNYKDPSNTQNFNNKHRNIKYFRCLDAVHIAS